MRSERFMAEFRVLVGLGNAPYGSNGLVAGARMQARPPFAGPVDPANHATPHAALSPDTNARTPSEVAQAWLKKGFGRDRLVEMPQIVDVEKSDLFDLLAYVAYALPQALPPATQPDVQVLTTHPFRCRQYFCLSLAFSWVIIGLGVNFAFLRAPGHD